MLQKLVLKIYIVIYLYNFYKNSVVGFNNNNYEEKIKILSFPSDENMPSIKIKNKFIEKVFKDIQEKYTNAIFKYKGYIFKHRFKKCIQLSTLSKNKCTLQFYIVFETNIILPGNEYCQFEFQKHSFPELQRKTYNIQILKYVVHQYVCRK